MRRGILVSLVVEVRTLPPDDPDALRLVDLMAAEIRQTHHFDDPTWVAGADPAVLTAYVAVYEDDRPVAGGALKDLGDGVAEIKRMYVAPELRGQGLARRVLAELEDEARARGFERTRLDTSDQQPHALALYRSTGYVEIPDYNANPFATYWAEKRL
jgi:GNAT superfamily N-acetyltransferase